MNKKILLSLVFIPFVTACNKRDMGFVDPFPNDPYMKIGFNISDEEKITGSLSKSDTDLILSTIENADILYPNIKKEEAQIRIRDYTRAFAGEFSQGYSSSNRLEDDDYVIFRQDEKLDKDTHKRQKKKEKTSTLYDFSYGRNKVEHDIDVYHYLAIDNDKGEVEEAYEDVADRAYEQTLIDNELDDYKKLGEKPSESFKINNDYDSWNESYFTISQGNYIFPQAEATLSGAHNKDVVLIKESQVPYRRDEQSEEGVYYFADGRTYRATINSLKVTILEKQTLSLNDETKEWYLVKYAREYSETAITSDVIQPNVPITTLERPIVINYREEKRWFYTGEISEISTERIDNVPGENYHE